MIIPWRFLPKSNDSGRCAHSRGPRFSFSWTVILLSWVIFPLSWILIGTWRTSFKNSKRVPSWSKGWKLNSLFADVGVLDFQFVSTEFLRSGSVLDVVPLVRTTSFFRWSSSSWSEVRRHLWWWLHFRTPQIYSVLLVMRVYALYDRKRWVVIFFTIAAVAIVGIGCVSLRLLSSTY